MNRICRILDRVKYFGLRWAYYTAIRFVGLLRERATDSGIFGEPAGSILNRQMARTLVTAYNGDSGHNIPDGTTFPGFGLIHYALVRAMRPKRLLCIGSRQGFIPAILAIACRDNGVGHVDFVDAGFDEDAPDKNWSGIGFWRKVDPKRHFGALGAGDHITTYVMTTAMFARKHPARTYDYIYIDGDHSDRGVRLDHRLFAPRLTRGGFLSFHDIVATGTLGSGEFGVYNLWSRLGKGRAIEFPFPASSGLGIWQRKP